eukprot:CAMPEP_0119337794 /NCGR_PEP_ID=MMETSP1333-20130426/94733_1 /TAXON_ID=418940 /ORGANISM="Scyphosphaera apsteinii, Strain RCC1455" /LENGTH=261 /DNA_ID=CAMNT_0007348923 /DNA_START=78 /DNA_END=863 /DNA_ORIENTATION=-
MTTGFYRRELPLLTVADFDRGTHAGVENLERLREASRALLAPNPMGVMREAYLTRLTGNFGIRLSRDFDTCRVLSRRMPDVASVTPYIKSPKGKDRIYPAYHNKLIKRRRNLEDYDEMTAAGAAARRQIRDVLSTVLEMNPKGLRSKTMVSMARDYGHIIGIDLAKILVQQMPDVAVWVSSASYSEYDAVRPADKSWGELKKQLSQSQIKAAWKARVHERFLQWFYDPYPCDLLARNGRVASEREGQVRIESDAEIRRAAS